MKKIILLALTALMIIGCDYRENDGSYDTSRNEGYETIIIDSCEYIRGGYSLAHKGNCRFCKECRQKELKELIEQLKDK